MALQLSTTLSKGVAAPECYAKIITNDYVKISNLDEELTGPRIVLAMYYNRAARDEDPKNYVETREYMCSDWSYETRELQYEYLHTLPEYTDALDV